MEAVGKQHWRARLEAEPAAVPALRRDVVMLLARECPELDLADVALAVSELVANVVRHAYPAGEPGAVEVEVERDGPATVVTVRDWGRGFAPLAGAERGLGVGLHIVCALADDLRISTSDCTVIEARFGPAA